MIRIRRDARSVWAAGTVAIGRTPWCCNHLQLYARSIRNPHRRRYVTRVEPAFDIELSLGLTGSAARRSLQDENRIRRRRNPDNRPSVQIETTIEALLTGGLGDPDSLSAFAAR